ncbi:condensation domain-containing protein [Nocardia africana]|uniref:Dimodular nonribosomal peptide synthase n=1 Tax=Nocardia africana TaxID=134964 RepID=A0A378WMY0_9NOCA|nr:condensation domain-containing protein [Nocardia africana]MCC3315904.1 condensation domain-containing protein [Nocardia africana]SUA41764.1 Dimodular nonribosomal peptide synthase [Nocardia africana]
MSDSPVPTTTAPATIAPKTAAAVTESRTGGRGIPLSPAQQAALLPERLRGVAATNLFLALEITGDLDPGGLDRAAVAAVSRHDILRTVYPDDRRIPYQRVVDAPQTVVETVETASSELDAALRSDAAHRIDPVRELPIRIRLHRTADRDILAITAHPVAADDRSIELLAAELLGGTTTEPVTQYRGYAMAQMKSLVADAAADPDLGYWLDRLADLPERATLIAAGNSGAESEPAAAATRTLRVPAAAFGDRDVELSVVAALAAVLGAAGLGGDVPVGIVDTGRAGAQYVSALGAYANHLVLRIDTDAAPSARALLAQVAELAVAARAHAAARIERITHQLRGAAAVAAGAPFQVLVTVRSEVSGPNAREIARRVARPHGVDIVADVVNGADEVAVTLEFPVALAGSTDIDALSSAIERWLLNLAAEPETSLRADELPTVFERSAAYAGGTGLGGKPSTDAERLIADTIREVLELDEDDDIGRADTFFALGGDSIAALRMVTLLGERGYVLDVQKVFEFPAVHDMAAQLTEAPAAPVAEQSAPVAPMSASGLDPAALAALGKKFAAR